MLSDDLKQIMRESKERTDQFVAESQRQAARMDAMFAESQRLSAQTNALFVESQRQSAQVTALFDKLMTGRTTVQGDATVKSQWSSAASSSIPQDPALKERSAPSGAVDKEVNEEIVQDFLSQAQTENDVWNGQINAALEQQRQGQTPDYAVVEGQQNKLAKVAQGLQEAMKQRCLF